MGSYFRGFECFLKVSLLLLFFFLGGGGWSWREEGGRGRFAAYELFGFWDLWFFGLEG